MNSELRLVETRLPSPPPGWFSYRAFPLDASSIALVATDMDVAQAHPRTLRERWPGVRLRISRFSEEGETDPIETSGFCWPLVARFGPRDWIVVGSRTSGRAGNAAVLSEAGAVRGRFNVGDGVQEIACGGDERVWVSYFDQGIFCGNDDAPGASGLALFDASGFCEWRFKAGDYRIADCYALSADGEAAWICPYDEFPIIRVADGRATFWSNVVEGASAIAAGHGHVILAGGYEGDANRVVLLRLAGENAHSAATFHVECEAGPLRFRGAGDTIHAISGDRWLRTSIARLLHQLV